MQKCFIGIGAKVSCEARKQTDLSLIKTYGYKAIELKRIDDEIRKI
ncbi:MAG: hypothetical protein IJN50_03465 [Clostridia bacterium]|nr:hypothetical protein [Clostridia bacterium]